MAISIFELFSIGIGPSSSHTVGPMRAAYAFMEKLIEKHPLSTIEHLQVDLYGSLALTGKGHGTDLAIINGLCGYLPESIEPNSMKTRFEQIKTTKKLQRQDNSTLAFDITTDLCFHQSESLPLHANGMRFSAHIKNNPHAITETYYSVGGGFIVTEEHFDGQLAEEKPVSYPFATAKSLLTQCENNQMSIATLMRANEKCFHSEAEIKKQLHAIANTMLDCIEQGCHAPAGELPGGLRVKRRAPGLYQKLSTNTSSTLAAAEILNWVNCYAIAVNEENANGGRVVTAPTNGAAGVIPAVLNYYIKFCNGTETGIEDFLLTAGAIGILYKKGASISAAEVGCQGEVGVACSMAAAALCAVLGGNLAQVENAAEIGMEHHLGLTCDPIAGLVQIPCIERNAMGATQAINIAHLALLETGEHHVSLDKVIATMLQTGKDMQSRYKETSLGGLAVNLPNC